MQRSFQKGVLGAVYADRFEAGRALARRLGAHRGGDAVVLGLARGGVAVGYAVALELNLQLAALVVRKLGAPQNPELAIGAVSETGEQWIDYDLALATGATEDYISREVVAQDAEAKRRREMYAVGASPSSAEGRTCIVVDDGIATGASALVAAKSARGLGATRVILATPVASPQACHFLERHVDELLVLEAPEPFLAVGMHYLRFSQVSDAEVVDLLRKAARHPASQ